MGLSIVTHPALEPVTLSELKKQLEIAATDTAHDTHLTRLITRARRMVERETRRALITQTWLMTGPGFPVGKRNVWLPRPPLQTVSWVKYYDTAGIQQTWTSAEYLVITTSTPGRVDLHPDYSWPTVQASRDNAVQIQYVAGYGDAAAAVPGELCQAIEALAAFWFEVRTTAEVPDPLLRFLRAQRSGAGPEHFQLVK